VDFDFEKGKTVLTKEEVTENREIIMEVYEPGQSVTLQGDRFEIKVAPMGEKEEGKTYIDFQSCEAKLREEFGLDESDVLSVFQTQTSITNVYTSTKVKNYENARIIQNFIKERIRSYFDKRQLINISVDRFNKFLKIKILKNI